MASFTADGIVDPLDFDLHPFVPLKGTIREPTQEQVQAFLIDSRQEAQRARVELFGDTADEDVTQSDFLAALGKLDPERTKETRARNAAIVSAVCSGHPTQAQLLKLPHRIMVAFAEWISNEVLNPEARAGGGTGQVLSLRSSAAG